MSLLGLHIAAMEFTAAELEALGFALPAAESERQKLLRSLFPHAIGHHLGMEVHDTASVPLSQPFADGHCITVEPGLYIPDEEAWGEFRGIGVRIEDAFVFRGRGTVLTAGAPKEIAEVEAAVAD